MSSTVEVTRGNGSGSSNNHHHHHGSGSGPSSAKPTPQSSGANKRPTLFQRMRKGSAADPHGSDASAAAPSNGSPINHNINTSGSGRGVPAAGDSGKPPLVAAAAAAPTAKPAVPSLASSGKAVPQADPRPPTQQTQAGNPVLQTTAASSHLGSSKRTSPGLTTPPSNDATAASSVDNMTALTRASPSPVAARPPPVFPVKTPLTTSADIVTSSNKSFSKKDGGDPATATPAGGSGSGAPGGATPTAPKGLTRTGASANPLQCSSNPLSLASSGASAAIANAAAQRREAGASPTMAAIAVSPAPAPTAKKPPPPLNGVKSVRESLRGSLQQQHQAATAAAAAKAAAASNRTTPALSPPTAALGSGSVGRKPAALTSTDAAVTNKVTLLPGKRSPSSTAAPAATLSGRVREGNHGSSPHNSSGNTGYSSAAYRPAPTTSAETNKGTSSAGSSHSSGTSAVQLSSTQKNITATRLPPPRSLNGLTSTTHASTTTPAAGLDKKAASTPLPSTTASPAARPGLNPTNPAPAGAATSATSPVNTPNATVDDDVDTRDAWMAEAYDFYAYSGRSMSEDDEAEAPYERVVPTPPQSAGGAGKRGSSPSATPTRNGAKRLSTTAGSLADMGYIMF